MQARQALRLSDEVILRVSYSISTEMDEFTLNRWRYDLESLKTKRALDATEYIALGRLYFALRRYDLYRECMAEGIGLREDIRLALDLAIGRLWLAAHGKSDELPRRVVTEWFVHPINKDREPLSFSSELGSLTDGERSFDLAKAPSLEVAFRSDWTAVLRFGPFEVTTSYDVLEAYDFDFSNVLIDEYAYRIGNDRISEEQTAFLRDILPEGSLDTIRRYLRDVEQTPVEDEVADRASVEDALELYARVGTESIVTHHGTDRIVGS